MGLVRLWKDRSDKLQRQWELLPFDKKLANLHVAHILQLEQHAACPL